MNKQVKAIKCFEKSVFAFVLIFFDAFVLGGERRHLLLHFAVQGPCFMRYRKVGWGNSSLVF